MPSSYSASLRFELQFTGENINLWGEKLNSALSRVDSAIAGFTTITLTGAAYTLSTANGSADEARSAILKFTGAPSTIFIPPVSKRYEVWNACSGPITITTGSGDTVAIEATDRVVVFCDGANVKTLGYGAYDLKTYITSQTAAAGAVPGTVGHLGKFLKVTADGGPSTWQQPASTDLSDIQSLKGLITALAVAL